MATFRAHADLALIPVTVTDMFNRFVLDLQKEDSRLLEDGVEQNLARFLVTRQARVFSNVARLSFLVAGLRT